MSGSDSRSIRELIEAIAETPLGQELHDPELCRRRVYRELVQDGDPLLREIGQQLQDEVVRPHQLLSIPGYEAVVDRGLERLQQLDEGMIREALVAYLDSGQGERGTGR